MLGLRGRSNPLVVVFTALCSGILFYYNDFTAFFFCAVMLLLLATRSRILHVFIGFIFGLISAYLAPSWVDLKDGLHLIQGVVCESYYNTGTYSLILKKVAVDGSRVRGNAQLNVYRNVVALGPGSVIRARANIRRQTGFGNENEFDYNKFLLSKNIVLKGSIDSADDVEIRRYVRPHGLKNDINALLSRLANPESEILKAMLTGDMSGITDNIRDSFNSLGISHLISISGLHMSIVICICYSLTFAVLRLIPPLSLRIDVPLIAKTGAIIGVAAYTLFVGTQIPTLRAGIMASCIILGFFLKRRTHVLDALAFAGILILILLPHSLYSASFLLSFSAVLGIIATIEKSAELPGWFLIFIIPIVAAAFTMPIIIYLFGNISYAGIIVNIVVVPFFSIAIMPLGILGLLLFPLSDTLTSLLFSLASDAIGLLLHLSDAIGSMISFPRPWLFWVYICYGGLIVAFFAEKTRLRSLILAVLGLAVISVPLIQHSIVISRPLSFDFISVGQGDSALITKGAHAVLIDAGPSQTGFDAGRYLVAPHLLRRGITALDLVIVTHMHPDHAGGIPHILERFPVKGVWVNSIHCGNPCFDDVNRVARRKDTIIKEVCLGDKLYLGGMTIHVLGPVKPWHPVKGDPDENMRSVVVLAGDKSMKGLFMGDADMFGELVLTHLRMDIRAHILKVAHHGSRRSCLEPFLDEVRPEIAVISCGANNSYGDPSPDPLGRLHKHGIRTYRTDVHGGITITSSSPSLKVKSGRLSADIH